MDHSDLRFDWLELAVGVAFVAVAFVERKVESLQRLPDSELGVGRSSAILDVVRPVQCLPRTTSPPTFVVVWLLECPGLGAASASCNSLHKPAVVVAAVAAFGAAAAGRIAAVASADCCCRKFVVAGSDLAAAVDESSDSEHSAAAFDAA